LLARDHQPTSSVTVTVTVAVAMSYMTPAMH
jgi:hypothetical protein